MRRIKRTKPSAALIVAVVALVAALGGGAVAGVAVTSLNKKETKKVRMIAKKQAKKLDKKIELTPGPKGDKGDPGATTAESALPFAYARVQGSDGTVSTDRPSKNITSANISHPADGVYCFDLPFTPETGAATSQADSGSDDTAMIELRGTNATLSQCTGTPQAEAKVINYDASFPGQRNDSFYIQLYK